MSDENETGTDNRLRSLIMLLQNLDSSGTCLPVYRLQIVEKDIIRRKTIQKTSSLEQKAII